MSVKIDLIAIQVSISHARNRSTASLGDIPSRSSISRVMPVSRSLAGLHAFVYVVHFAAGRIRQAPDVIEPSSWMIG